MTSQEYKLAERAVKALETIAEALKIETAEGALNIPELIYQFTEVARGRNG